MDFKKGIVFLFAMLMLAACASAPVEKNNDETRARANEAYQEIDAE